MDEIVQASGFSKYYFNRLFKKRMGITPFQYLTTLRINRAILFLCNPSLTIDEIVQKAGFSNADYFAKVFKTHFDYSPSNLRNRDSFNLLDYWISDL